MPAGLSAMKLSERVTDALNEVRILILGAQILLGFQFNAAFQPKFVRMAGYLQWLDVVALTLMLAAAGVLVAPAPFHRLVEDGNDSAPLVRFATRAATLALAPFALCIGIDAYIVVNPLLGQAAAIAGGGLLATLAGVFWYGIEVTKTKIEGPPPNDD